jgi:chromosome segregation ATPase
VFGSSSGAAAELIAALSERITQFEHQLSCQVSIIVPELKETITNHERRLESLLSVIEAKREINRTEIDALRQFAQLLQTELEAMNSKCEKQNEALVARIASVEGKMSDSLSSITSCPTVCERSIVTYGPQMNEVRASVEELRTQVGGIDV